MAHPWMATMIGRVQFEDLQDAPMAAAHELVMTEGGGVVPDDGYIPAGRPRLALASPDDGTNLRTALQLAQNVEQAGVHVVVERIAFVRIVVRDHGNWTVYVEENLVCHDVPFLR